MYYYEISGFHFDDYTRPDDGWAQSVGRKLFCPECGALRILGNEQTDIVLAATPRQIPLCGLAVLRIGYAKKAFLASLGWQLVLQHFHLGRVFDAQLRPLEDYVTFRTKTRVLFIRTRGNRAPDDFCPVCGMRLYCALPPRNLYVTTPSLTGAPIYESNRGQLILNEQLFKQLDPSTRRALYVEKLSVLDHAVDGLADVITLFDRPQSSPTSPSAIK